HRNTTHFNHARPDEIPSFSLANAGGKGHHLSLPETARFQFAVGMSQQQKVYYFDNNATTQVAPEVISAMLPFLRDQWGNPSSAYSFGKQVDTPIEDARASTAALINADPREIIFTSCGTESNNSAIHSALVTHPEKRHIVTTAVEHSANIKFCEYLQK